MLPWSFQMAWRQRLQNMNISSNPFEISKTKNVLTGYWSLYPHEMVLVLWKALLRVFANISLFFFLLQSCLRLFFAYGIAKRDLGISLSYTLVLILTLPHFTVWGKDRYVCFAGKLLNAVEQQYWGVIYF